MSTMVTAGIPLAIDGPLPSAPPYGLVPTVQVVPDADVHWGEGVSVWPYPTGLPRAWNPCEASPKGDQAQDPWTDVGAFPIILPFSCTNRALPPWEELRRRLLAAYAARESYGLEVELVAQDAAAAMPSNPHLGDVTMIDVSGAAVSPFEALALLENAIAATGEQGVIHAEPGLVSAWSADKLTVTAGKLRTFNGTLVVSGSGYVGATPAGEAALGDAQSWAFATGPVQIRRAEPFLNPDTLGQALDRESNDVVAVAERYYAITWDPEHLHAGALADRSVT